MFHTTIACGIILLIICVPSNSNPQRPGNAPVDILLDTIGTALELNSFTADAFDKSFGFGLKFDYNIFINWKHMNNLEKLYYLLEDRDVLLLYKEYNDIVTYYEEKLRNEMKDSCEPQYVSEVEISREEYHPVVTYEILWKYLEEYRSTSAIKRMFKDCDIDGDGFMTFTEYVLCRGFYDVYGNEGMNNEYDQRANALIADIEELISSGRPVPGVFNYDENGIIID